MKLALAFFFLTVLSLSWTAHAQTKSSGFAKSQNKESSRWTLQEWLAQKDRNMMMDLWLGMYAPSPYEFFLSGSYLTSDTKVSTTPAQGPPTQAAHASAKASAGAYALILGLQGEYENNAEEHFNDTAGSLNLRVLGNAVQGTHVILHYGLRTRTQDGAETLRQQFAGADLNLYLSRLFGLSGLYRAYLPTHNTDLGDVSATRTEAGLFIDFGPLRVFGHWFSETQTSEKTQITTDLNRTGLQSGLQFFF